MIATTIGRRFLVDGSCVESTSVLCREARPSLPRFPFDESFSDIATHAPRASFQIVRYERFIYLYNLVKHRKYSFSSPKVIKPISGYSVRPAIVSLRACCLNSIRCVQAARSHPPVSFVHQTHVGDLSRVMSIDHDTHVLTDARHIPEIDVLSNRHLARGPCIMNT